MLSFLLSTLLAAKAGILAAAWWGGVGSASPGEVAQAAGAVAGIVFHPVVAVLVKAAPGIVQARLGSQGESKQ